TRTGVLILRCGAAGRVRAHAGKGIATRGHPAEKRGCVIAAARHNGVAEWSSPLLHPEGLSMSRGYNFSAGPRALPEPVLRQAQAEMLDWGKARASVMEVSHRGKEFIALAAESERDLRQLLQIPQNYKVLFLQGGATQHFAQIPMNFARKEQTAD